MIYFRLMLILLFSSSLAWGWGFAGHRAIAMIAAQHLTPTTKQALKPIQHQDSLEKLSIWPDTIRLYYPSTVRWHYTTLNPSDTQPPKSKNGQIYQQLCLNTLKLIHRENEHWQVQHRALSWVIHLVGDAHQPLHIGNGYDRGGNQCLVYWFKRKKPVTLHKIWDNFLVKATLKHHDLHHINIIDDATLKQPPLVWMLSARQLHNKIYPKQRTSYCNQKIMQTLPRLGRKYVEKNRSLVWQQLNLAGQRLAYLLNMIFDTDFRQTHMPLTRWLNCDLPTNIMQR